MSADIRSSNGRQARDGNRSPVEQHAEVPLSER